MKSKINKLIIFALTLVITQIDIIRIKAYWVTGYNNGSTFGIDLPDCLMWNGEGCGGMSENFVVRVTLVDGNNVKVEGTTAINLWPWHAYDGDYSYLTDDSYGEWDHDYRGDNATLWYNDDVLADNVNLSRYGRQNYKLTASSIAWNGYGEDRTDRYYSYTPGYEIYMGDYYEPNDFSTHSWFRDLLESNIKNETVRPIYVNEINDKISIADFILRMTGANAYFGHPDEWKASENNDIRRRIADDNYKFMIEPVYTMSLTYWGEDHNVRGTAKQIATVLSNTANNAGNEGWEYWYWPMHYSRYAYNLACGLRAEGDTSLCDDEGNFDIARKTAQDIVEANNYCNRLSGPAKDACYAGRVQTATRAYNSRSSQFSRIANLYSTIANPDSAYGVNYLYLNDAYTGPIKEEIENKCEFNISSCENNGFTFSSKLDSSTGDIFDCIYPSETNRRNGALSQYSVQFENADLWCYDNTTYSFEQLRDSFRFDSSINISPIVTNQLLAIPHGTLTVERICFSKNDNVPTGDLDAVFAADDARYQDEFKLNLNGKEYTYKRGQKYQGTRDKISGFNITKTQEDNTHGESYYKYTSTFNYDYELTVGEDAMKSNINILNYNISSALGSSNGIDYSKNIAAKVINAPTMENKEYTNTLYTNNSTKEARINGGYGYSNNFFDALDGYSGDTKNDSNTLERSGQRQEWYDDEYYSFTNTYIMTEKVNKNCNFKTTGTDVNVWEEIQFRTISLSNPFPGRDGTSRIPGTNWLSKTNNFVYDYIQNNRNVTAEEVYNKEPLYTVTLDTQSMIKIREYNKNHNYSDYGLVCESGTGRKCRSNFLRNNEYIKKLEGTCSSLDIDYYSCADKSFTSGG